MLPIEFSSILFLMCTFLKQSEQYENLALGKPVTVSKRYNNKNFDPSLAVDGDVSTNLLKCTLTASGQNEAWLTVDLLEVNNITSISFVHGGLGLNDTEIDLSHSFLYPSSNGNGTLQQTNGITICPEFSDRNAKVVCLSWGYLPDNATIYKVQADNLQFPNGVTQCRGDESTIEDCTFSARRNGCIHNGEQIFLSCKSGNTLAGFSVYVSDTTDWKSGQLCYQHDMTKPIDNNINVDCFITGRYVTIANSRNGSSYSTISNFAYINICELNVTGCDVGHYGEKCSICPVNCLNNACQIQNGDCFNCKDGFTGRNCKEDCMTGWYGRECAFQCGMCFNQETCDHVNGSCHLRCSPGWKGDYCDQQCDSGYFGLECNSTCYNTHCQNTTNCDPVYGQCAVDCVNGWAGTYCEECAPTYHGERCNNTCSDFCLNKLCNQTTGHCLSCFGNRTGVFCENEDPTNPPQAAAFDTNVGFIATSVILSIVVIGIVLYALKRKCSPTSVHSPERSYELPTVTKSTTEYEEIHSRHAEGEIDKSASEYSEIGTVQHCEQQTMYTNMVLD